MLRTASKSLNSLLTDSSLKSYSGTLYVLIADRKGKDAKLNVYQNSPWKFGASRDPMERKVRL